MPFDHPNQVAPSNRIAPSRHSSADSSAPVEVSVISPVLDEAKTVVRLVQGIANALRGRRYEIILVDDGSTDSSWEMIGLLAAEQPGIVKGVRHRRNFGKAEALSSGFAIAEGRYLVSIDSDLQDDPEEIPRLIAKLESGYDLVSGWKQRRQDPWSKTLPSRVFNFATRTVSGIKLHDFNCGLKAYRQEAAQSLKLYGELYRFIPILVDAEGYRVAELPVNHFPRCHGKSKYGWGRLAKGALDLLTVVSITRYSKRPGHFFGGGGLLIGSVGVVILSHLSLMKLLFGQDIGTRPLFFFGLLAVLFGGQLVSTGIIGELLLRQGSAKGSVSNRGPESKPESFRPAL